MDDLEERVRKRGQCSPRFPVSGQTKLHQGRHIHLKHVFHRGSGKKTTTAGGGKELLVMTENLT